MLPILRMQFNRVLMIIYLPFLAPRPLQLVSGRRQGEYSAATNVSPSRSQRGIRSTHYDGLEE